MIALCGLNRAELTALMKDMGQGAYRAAQIQSWVTRSADISEMTNLAAALREKLAQTCVANPVTIQSALTSKIDGTEKYLFRLMDGNLIEGVLMRYKHGDTLCISTQVGCRMGCAFCASTLEGCARNLEPGEMIGEILAVNRRLIDKGEKIHNVVLMGSGEPLDNYDNVVKFLRLAIDPEGLNLSVRGISLSTCGLAPAMRRFADEGLPVTLSLSLHAPNDHVRKMLMPVANAYGIDEILNACRYYIEKTGRRVIFEYAMAKGVNCEMAHADELAGRLRGMQCHVNLIPLNSVKERSLLAPSEGEIEAFMRRLESRHISVTRRREMGDDIQGACGQLRRRVLNQGT